jgi:hypothetical protein
MLFGILLIIAVIVYAIWDRGHDLRHVRKVRRQTEAEYKATTGLELFPKHDKEGE